MVAQASPFTEAYFTPQSSTVPSESPNVRHSAGSNFSADQPPTYLKLHNGEYKRVYRLSLPKDGKMTREYVLQQLPQLNLSGKITRNEHDDKPIASGGFADVHKNTVNGQAVAIKVMRTSLEEEKLRKVEKMSLRELLTWSQLTHENILELLGYTLDYYPPCISFVSAWQENGNATNYLREKGIDVVRQVLAGAVCGLKYLHGKQMVHGNFRGNNILIGKKGEALVADFGFARILEQAGFFSISPPGGNARWMAPELLAGNTDEGRECTHTEESDMWSVGMTILELCSSKVPYCESPRDTHALLRAARGELPKRHDRVPELLWQICTELWCINPSGRPTVNEVFSFLTLETRVASSTPKDLFTNILDSHNLRFANIVVRAGIFANIDVDYWRDSLQRALSEHCQDEGRSFSGALLSYLVELEVIDINWRGCGCEHTPLLHLAMSARDSILAGDMALLAHPRIDVNATGFEGMTALHYCALNGHYTLLDGLLAHPDIDVNIKDSDGRTPVWRVFSHYQVHDAAAKSLLRHPKIDVTLTDPTGQTLLHYAILQNATSVVQMLLDLDEDNVNAKDGMRLHYSRVDINSTDLKGKTPLHYAVTGEECSHDIVRVLLQSEEIDVNIADRDGRTALSHAAQHGYEATVSLLLRHSNIEVNTVDSDGRTALHYAFIHNKGAVVSHLLRSPTIDLSIPDKRGRIPLLYAGEHDSY